MQTNVINIIPISKYSLETVTGKSIPKTVVNYYKKLNFFLLVCHAQFFPLIYILHY